MTEPDRIAATGHRVRTIAGREVLFDPEGFLADASAWDDDLARFLASEQGIQCLSEAQWKVIRFMREYYLNQGRAPLNHELKGGTSFTMMELETMFPGGIRNGARLLAGLPNPRTCM